MYHGKESDSSEVLLEWQWLSDACAGVSDEHIGQGETQ
jgi:hypothetical protein